GAAAWSEEELARAPRTAVLGHQASVATVDGRLKRAPKPDLEDASLLGVALTRPGGSVFVKLTGPKARVEQLRGDFVAFCASLSEVR
ncbi:MAG: hypothetical protein HZA53_09465, partial [Planctomycetes bacterium]|nr:hypothetical protein [Planctomycetota bacterium]